MKVTPQQRTKFWVLDWLSRSAQAALPVTIEYGIPTAGIACNVNVLWNNLTFSLENCIEHHRTSSCGDGVRLLSVVNNNDKRLGFR